MEKFRLGLTMAGAISAGAYSGGVFDMLFEALEAWERRKQKQKDLPPERWTVPGHDVVVQVMSGASAGGITGSIGLQALADSDRPETPICHKVHGVEVQTTLPRLYEAWVRAPRFIGDATRGGLLGQDDLGGKVLSVLDSTVLDRIADKAIANYQGTAPRPYLAARMHLFLTATNLQGVPYEIAFTAAGEPAGYVMTCHADRVHFVLHGVGSCHVESAWADRDPGPILDVAELASLPTPRPQAWQDLIDATLATGAFPIGLRARRLPDLPMADLVARQWTSKDTRANKGDYRLAPAWAGDDGPELMNSSHEELRVRLAGSLVERRAVDGGVIDNEPFELARWTLMRDPPEPNPREARCATRAVLMIDPFPSQPAPDPAAPDDALLAIIGQFVPMLISQTRFKLDAVAAALSENANSRFLIAPRRYARDCGKWVPEDHAIACGLLGGFGGFLSEAMRAHDYQLGRLNAWRFLKSHFALPRDNIVLSHGYPVGMNAEAFQAEPASGCAPAQFQVIPIADLVPEPDPPNWPRVGPAEVDAFVRAARDRAEALLGRLVPANVAGAARLFFRVFLRRTFEEQVRWRLMAELFLRDQWADLPDEPDRARRATRGKVLACLANPAYQGRTVDGILAEHEIARDQVDACIATLRDRLESGPAFETWRLRARRRPRLIWRILRGPGKVG
jgi:hypothetical protein